MGWGIAVWTYTMSNIMDCRKYIEPSAFREGNQYSVLIQGSFTKNLDRLIWRPKILKNLCNDIGDYEGLNCLFSYRPLNY